MESFSWGRCGFSSGAQCGKRGSGHESVGGLGFDVYGIALDSI
jgi:hypothetical protein